MSTKKSHPLIPDEYIRFLFGIIVFVALISGGTYYLQSSLIIKNSWGVFAHWAAILILLPVLSGLIQHLIQSPARLVLATLGAIVSSAILYPAYAGHLWASPPDITAVIVFTLAIAGIGFTSSINPHDRHVKQRRAIKRRKKSPHKKEAHEHVDPHGDGLVDNLLNSSLIRSLELALSIISIIAGIWGTISLGLSALD